MWSNYPVMVRVVIAWMLLSGSEGYSIEKIRSVPSRGTQHVPGTKGYAGEKLNVDLVRPLPTTPDGYRYVLTIQDDSATVKVREWESSPSKQWLILSNLLDAVLRWSLQHRTVRYFRLAIKVYTVQQRFPWTEMHQVKQQRKPKDEEEKDENGAESEDIQCPRDISGRNIAIWDCTGAPTATSEHLAGAVKDTVAEELLPAIPIHMEVQDAVLRSADNASMAAGPPTMSRHVTAVPLKTKEVVEVARNIMGHYIAVYGCLLQIFSDNGTELKSRVWGEVMKKIRAQQLFTSSYNPSSNQVERFHQVLYNMLRIYGPKNNHAWIQCLSAACLAYNAKKNDAAGVTLFTAMLGGEAKLPVDLIVGLPTTESRIIPEHIKQLWNNYEKRYAYIRKSDQTVIRRKAHQYQGGEYKEIVESGLFWYYCPRQVPGKLHKLTSVWMEITIFPPTLNSPIQTGVPATDMVDLAEVMKDATAEEETPVATGYVEVEDAVLKDTADQSMMAEPPTVKEPASRTCDVDWQEVKRLPSTNRGEGGLGSTG